MNSVAIVKHKALDAVQSAGLYQLRYSVFSKRLNWQVSSEQGMERDQFDTEETVYLLTHNERKEVSGCLRLIPTTQPYMLRDVFPELLYQHPAPCNKHIWEVSRFASLNPEGHPHEFGFAHSAKSLIQAAVRFAIENDIHRYVLVTSVAVERMLLKLGVNMVRIGPPKQIGEVLSVACFFENDQETVQALFGTRTKGH